MTRVIVSVTNNLVTDQRVARVCRSLHDWGFDVLLVGRQWPAEVLEARCYRCKRFKLVFKKKFLFYAEYNMRLFLFLLFHKAEILISNDLDTLPANYFAAKLKRCRLLFDSHEYFPETPEVYQRKFVKSFWLKIEKLFIGRCNVCYTVSESLANIYLDKYKLRFHVVRNVPYTYKLNETPAGQPPLILYQGTMNIGRGLELMISTMSLIRGAKLVIAGDGPMLNKLKVLASQLAVNDRVMFTGKLSPDKLRALTVHASVGISLEEPMGQSYISALPNKLFDYIAAHVPVLVSDLPEMKAIVDKYKVGMVLDERTPQRLSSIVGLMLTDVDKRNGWKKNLVEAARELCWENESLKLKALIDES